jgi:hypothetical protein
MRQSKPYIPTPVSEDRTEHRPSPDLIEELETIKAAIAEAEDLAAEFAVEMRLEAQRLSRELRDR